MKKSLQFPLFVAGAAAVLGLAACSKTETASKAVSQPVETAKKKTLTLYSWAEYFDVELFEKFEAETGIAVNYQGFENTDEMEAKLKSQPGNWDVIVADDLALDQMSELKLIRKLDKSLLPNLKNIDEMYRSLPFDPKGEMQVPYMWGTTLIAYRKDKIPEPSDSWNLLWDERYKGKVMMIDERTEILSVPLMLLGHKLENPELAQMSAAADMLLQQIDQVDVRLGDDFDVREGLKDGSVWAAMCYSGDAASVAEKDENVGFFIPKEGALLWVDSFAVVRDSRMPKEAHQLINFMLEAKNAAANTNFACFASPNKAAHEFIDPELLADKSINPPQEVLDRCQWWSALSADRGEFLNEAWLNVHTRLLQKEGEEAVDGVATSGVDPELEGADIE